MTESTNNIVDTLETSMLELVDGAVTFVPKLLVALLLLMIGSIVARVISGFIGRALRFVENHKFVTGTLADLKISTVAVSGILSTVAKWAIMLIFWGAAVDVLGLEVLTDTFNALLAFVPRIFAAALVAGLTFVAGRAVRDIVTDTAHKAGVGPYRVLGSVARGAVLLFGVPLAAAQLGFDMTIINNNLTVIVAGIMLALGLAFGLGGREVAGKMVGDAYQAFKKPKHSKSHGRIQ